MMATFLTSALAFIAGAPAKAPKARGNHEERMFQVCFPTFPERCRGIDAGERRTKLDTCEDKIK